MNVATGGNIVETKYYYPTFSCSSPHHNNVIVAANDDPDVGQFFYKIHYRTGVLVRSNESRNFFKVTYR
jgi:hypothetical protein